MAEKAEKPAIITTNNGSRGYLPGFLAEEAPVAPGFLFFVARKTGIHMIDFKENL
ncbi:hypothetical protein J42TS3_46100 [Paenibacillus vini]|uniref:Uncharacterized protein n=1 Tax=Paenibacillus vini TaxID=1476024 RepID=A0ABQ4MHW1_9BACL|nr:hypothetical protein J42TS3_46100 [Paenibacillus vini]